MQGGSSGVTESENEKQELDGDFIKISRLSLTNVLAVPSIKGSSVSSNDSLEYSTRNTGTVIQKLKTGEIGSGFIHFLGFLSFSAIAKSDQFSSQATVDNNEDWEAELQKELLEFELVNEDNEKDTNDLEEKVNFDDLEKEIMSELEK